MNLNEIPMEQKIRLGQAINLTYQYWAGTMRGIEPEHFFGKVMHNYELIENIQANFCEKYAAQQKKMAELEESIPEVVVKPNETFTGDEIIPEDDDMQPEWVGEED